MRAKQRSSLIYRCFRSRDPVLLFRAFTTYVRPLLEYCTIIWSPCYLKYVNLIERVQRNFTKRLCGYFDLHYSERLKLLKCDTLELRRLKFDLIMMYKIVYGFVDVDASVLFDFINAKESKTRGHDKRIIKKASVLQSGVNSFCNRNVTVWNSLPQYVIAAASVNMFKTYLNKLDLSKYLVVCD